MVGLNISFLSSIFPIELAEYFFSFDVFSLCRHLVKRSNADKSHPYYLTKYVTFSHSPPFAPHVQFHLSLPLPFHVHPSFQVQRSLLNRPSPRRIWQGNQYHHHRRHSPHHLRRPGLHAALGHRLNPSSHLPLRRELRNLVPEYIRPHETSIIRRECPSIR